jgi:hypothetical protein
MWTEFQGAGHLQVTDLSNDMLSYRSTPNTEHELTALPDDLGPFARYLASLMLGAVRSIARNHARLHAMLRK